MKYTIKSSNKPRKKTRKNSKNMSKCNPKNNNNASCFSKNALLKIINKWNEKNNNKIIFSNSDSVEILWNLLNKKLQNLCNDELCWSKLPFIKELNDEEIKHAFRPKMPKSWYKNTREWLSTTDINNVLKQYQQKYSDFKYIGAIPIDFDNKDSFGSCIVNEMCSLNINSIKRKNIKRIGVVFNLDKHDEPGSHWVALFIDLNKNNIYFFDSYGIKPPKEVRILMNRLKSQAKNNNQKIKLFYNNIRHQYKNSECGVYSINFIVKLLEGHDYNELIKNKIDDDTMNTFRNKFFIKD